MNAIVQLLNTAGRAFVDFAVPMLIQSSLLILILLVVDAVLRKRVRAVFRYWIWMLVLVKLVLPPSLWSPVSVGTWLGDKLEVSTTALLEAPRLPSPEEQGRDALATRLSPAVTNFPSRPQPVFVEPPAMNPAMAPPSPLPTEAANSVTSTDHPPALSLNWQGLVLLVWMAVVTVLLLLLAQRTFFVQGLVAQGEEAGRAMLGELDRCRQHLGLPKPISLRLSPNAASPAICGLLRPGDPDPPESRLAPARGRPAGGPVPRTGPPQAGRPVGQPHPDASANRLFLQPAAVAGEHAHSPHSREGGR